MDVDVKTSPFCQPVSLAGCPSRIQTYPAHQVFYAESLAAHGNRANVGVYRLPTHLGAVLRLYSSPLMLAQEPREAAAPVVLNAIARFRADLQWVRAFAMLRVSRCVPAIAFVMTKAVGGD